MGAHTISCVKCGNKFSGYLPSCSCNSLLRAKYHNKLIPRNYQGMWKFIDWLPCKKPLSTNVGPILYKSDYLGKELGLSNLYIAFRYLP